MMTPLPSCTTAQVHYWQDPAGHWWETFSLPGQVKVDNEIIRPVAATQTPAAEVLASRGLCTLAPAPMAAQATTAPLTDGTGGGALLLLLAIGGSAVWAYFQQKNDKGDFAEDYHPMSDVPLLPPVATNENLDLIFERTGYPQYQGIDEPNPFNVIELRPRQHAATQTPAAEVLASRGLCSLAPAPMAAQAATAPLTDGTGGGALLLLLAIGGSAVWAYFQQKNDKGDFAEDYHPMSDAPMLPPVATNENLDLIFERTGYPQYQGIDEPNPFNVIELRPRQHAATQTTPPPVATSIPPVEATDFSTGDTTPAADLVRAREYFESEVFPVPRNGHSITNECLLNNGTAYQLVRQAVVLGYSQNWISEHLFKASKGSQKYNLVRDMVNRCREELSHE